MADEFIRSQANGVLLKTLIAYLGDVLLRDYETRRGRRRAIEGHKIRPGGVQMEAHRPLVDDLHAFHLGLIFLRARTFIARKAEAHVLCRTGLTVMKCQP